MTLLLSRSVVAGALALPLLFAVACGNRMIDDHGAAPDSGARPPTVDDSDPTHQERAVFYVSPTGDDAAPGTAARPWRSIKRKLLNLSAGQTLVLLGGTYNETGLLVSRAGTPQSPIRIRGEPGAFALIDGSFPEFRAAPNQAWQLVDPVRQIHRSTRRYPELGQVFGYLPTQDGGHQLVPYEHLASFLSTNEDYSDAAPYYVGPGVYWHPGDQYIYIRLSHGRYQARLGYASPGVLDPRLLPLRIFADRSLLQFQGAEHVVVENLALCHGEYTVHIAGDSHHITLRDLDIRGGRYATVVRDGAHDLTFDDVRFDGGFPPWVARSDVKEPQANAPAHSMQGAGIILEGHTNAIEIANCRFRALFDAIDATVRPSRLRVHDCWFDTIRDDVLQLGSAGHDIEFDHNLIRRAAAGVSWHGSGAPPPGRVGTKYIHHNVIDTSTRQLYGRDDPLGLLPPRWRGPNGDGFASGPAIGAHAESAVTGPDPFKIYCNTIVGAEDVDLGGAGIGYGFAPFDPTRPHEVLNNILVQAGDQWIVQDVRVHDGSQIFDGNVYFRALPAPSADLCEDFDDGVNNSDFPRLTNFRASSHWSATRGYYPPGWEASGIEADPMLDADYRPAQAGPAATGAIDLSGRPWPGVTSQPYRGALPAR